jgi:hypothetical protein
MRHIFTLLLLAGALLYATDSTAQVAPPSPQNRPEATPAPAAQNTQAAATSAAPPVVPPRSAPPLSGEQAEKAREHLQKEREKAARDAERDQRRNRE